MEATYIVYLTITLVIPLIVFFKVRHHNLLHPKPSQGLIYKIYVLLQDLDSWESQSRGGMRFRYTIYTHKTLPLTINHYISSNEEKLALTKKEEESVKAMIENFKYRFHQKEYAKYEVERQERFLKQREEQKSLEQVIDLNTGISKDRIKQKMKQIF